MALADVQIEHMINLGVPPAQAPAAAAAASSAGSAAAFNAVVTQYGGTVTSTPTGPTGPAAGSVISQSSSPNGDGTYTVITVYSDGKGGTYSQTSQAGVKTTGPSGPTGATGPIATGATGTVDPTIAALQKQLADLQAANATSTAQTAATTAAAQQNAIQFLTTTFTDLGLGADVAAAVTQLVQQGYTADTIQLMAQDPKSTNPLAVAFQQRFPANAARLAAGLPVLSPGQYIATEQSYAQVMQAYGLNSSFATNKDIFTKLLTADVSPTELNTRVSTAKQVVNNTDPLVTQQLQQYYGLSQADMIAHVLDPAVATPIIEKQISAAQIGAESARYGVNVGQGQAEQLSGLGISQAQANQGFQNIASQLPNTQALATRYGAYGPAGDVGQALQAATFGTTGSVNAQSELERLRMQEISQFSASSGVGKGSISQLEEGLS